MLLSKENNADVNRIRLKLTAPHVFLKPVLNISHAEIELLVASMDSSTPAEARSSTVNFLDNAEVEKFEEEWSREMEETASAAALEYLEGLTLPSVREFLAAADISPSYLESIQRFSVEDFEGLEDTDVISVAQREGTTVAVSYSFDLLSVVWTVEIPSTEYLARAADFDEHFLNVAANGETTSMEVIQRCYLEAELLFDRETGEFTSASITLAGVKRQRRRNQAAR